MSFNYKNPISPLTSLGNISLPIDSTVGTNYSILGTGGYMEVYSLNDLNYVIPSGLTGLIEYSANTIPIQFNKGLGTVFSPDVLTLHSDNISSGRRKLGMLVYVYESNKIYQHTIDNYDLLWTAATSSSGPGGPTVVISEFGTTVKNNSVAGQNLINAWTASTIEGVSGYTNLNATWRILQTGGGGTFTGGTVTGSTIFTNGLTANTFSASTYLGLPADIFITGGTFDTNTDTLTLERSSGSSITITGFTDYYTTAFTYSSNTFTIYDNSGNTFPVTVNEFTGLTINGIISATTFSGGTFYGDGSNLTGVNFTGGTVSGNTIFLQGLTANTISASTYQNLPIDPDTYVTGFTYSANTFTIYDNSGNTFNSTFNDVTGLTVNGIFNVSGATSTFTNSAPNSTVAQFYIGSSGNLKFINSTNPSKYIGVNETSVFGANIGTGANSFTVYGASSSVAVNAEGGLPVYLQNGIQFSTGNVIIGSLLDPGFKLFVSGNTLVTGTTVTENFKMTSGATSGYVLTSDSSGNAFWNPVSGSSGFPQYFISASTPTGYTLNVGDRWYDTNTGAEYVWNYDGTTYQWVQPAGIPGPQGPQGVSGFSNLLITTGVTNSAETLTTGYTYYGIIHTNIVNLTLPNPSGIDGFNLSIKDESGNAGIYRIRLTSPVGTIDGNNYVDMNINYMSLHLVARNTNWWII